MIVLALQALVNVGNLQTCESRGAEKASRRSRLCLANKPVLVCVPARNEQCKSNGIINAKLHVSMPHGSLAGLSGTQSATHAFYGTDFLTSSEKVRWRAHSTLQILTEPFWPGCGMHKYHQ